MAKITDTMVCNKYDELIAELEKLKFDYTEVVDDEKVWDLAYKELEASLDEHYDNKYEQMKEERAGIC